MFFFYCLFSLLNVTSQFPFTGLQDISHDARAERPRVAEVYSHEAETRVGYILYSWCP